MITLYVDSDHATPAVMKRLRALADNCPTKEPRFSGEVIEIKKGDYTCIEDDGNVDGYDVQAFFNDATATIQGHQA